jgi:hypothetical protein
LVVGLIGQAVGLVILAAGMELTNLPAFLIGGAVTGAGAGLLFKWAVGAVVAMAAPEVRGEALAGLFLIAYAGLVLSALGLGVATLSMTPTTAMLVFSVVILVLLAGVAVLRGRAARASVSTQVR